MIQQPVCYGTLVLAVAEASLKHCYLHMVLYRLYPVEPFGVMSHHIHDEDVIKIFCVNDAVYFLV